jgi:biotin synthase
MATHTIPPMEQYRRIQLARYLIDHELSREEKFHFNEKGQIRHFGLADCEINDFINSGEPFRTSGCEGYDGEVACNRPYANSRPGPHIRNYPFKPDSRDITRIRNQIESAPEMEHFQD